MENEIYPGIEEMLAALKVRNKINPCNLQTGSVCKTDLSTAGAGKIF